jgi:Carboxypeptidase regulatory-like domain/TonB-dependent Receptor Plug Domain
MRSVAFLIAMFTCASIAHAQVTTATMRGTVKSADDGVAMAEVEVTLLHVPTGNIKTTTTNSDGAYAFSGLRVGGPYRVIAKIEGFKPAEEDGIVLSAGKTRDVTLELHLQEEVIEVGGVSIPRTTSSRTVVTSQEIEALPSVGRDPRDLVRRAPDVTVEGSSHTMSIQGANPRFNSVTVDGIRQDDDFGLNSNGYPTLRSPIALSAIEEMTVESTPFDVRYGKFMGGNVNIVTKSGTNDFKGELLGTYSSDALAGNHIGGLRITNTKFHEYRYGGALGGPIVKDKVHFFLDVEGLSASTPVSVGPAGSTAANTVSKVTQDEVTMAQQIAKSVYNFDAGVPSRNIDESDVNVFSKVDWAATDQHRVTVTYQRTGGSAISATSFSSTSLPLSSDWFSALDTLNTFSGRLFSDWSDKLSTEVEVSGKIVTNKVDPLNGNGFMQATIKTPEGGQIVLGPDQFRHSNALDNDTFHAKAVANYLAGNNLVTGGLEYELLHIDNLFIAATNGAVTYASLAAFEAQTPLSISYSNATTLNPADGAANWNAGTLTGYMQDQLKVTSELTVTGGLRLETLTADTKITENPNFVTRNGFANTATLNGRSILMPRLGVSYVPIDRLNLRAGTGLYSGGSPNVWVSNNYTNDGVRIASVFSQDPNVINGFDGRNIPDGIKTMVKAGNGNVDALDPNFKLPSAWKIGGGGEYSFDIPWLEAAGKNVEVKVNYTYTKVHEGVTWTDLRRNLASLPDNVPVGTLPDGRPLYDTAMTGFNASRGYDMLLTNNHQGYGHSASVVLEKGFPFGLFVSGTYGYEHVMEVNPANSSRSVSNYSLLAVTDPNNPGLSVSNYEREHRFTGAVEFSRAIIGDITASRSWKDLKTSFGLFAESRSGQPYSWTFSDANFGTNLAKIFGEERTFSANNHQLFYVPKGDGSDVILNGISQADFDAFLKSSGLDKYRGQIAPRNAFTSPWFNKIDVRFAQDLPNPLGHRARFTVDIENFGNLLDHKWGRASIVPFPYMTPAVDVSYDAPSGKYIYSNLRNPSATVVDVFASVWRVSLGLMYDF